MELRHLRYFITVAEELHFGRAASRLFIAQPPLSQQIRQLEEELQVELFKRTNRRVELTTAGQVFFKEAQHILAQVEHAKLLAQRAARGELGELAIGFISTATFGSLPSLLYNFREKYPYIHVTLHEMRKDQQIAALFTNEIQIGIARPAINSAEICTEIIQREPLVLALPSNHPLVSKKRIAIRDLRNESFVMLPRYLGSVLYDQIISLCYNAGFSPNVTQEAAEFHTIIGLVGANLGLSIVPASARLLHHSHVVYRRLEGETSYTELALLWRRDNDSPVVRACLEIAQQLNFTIGEDEEEDQELGK